MAKIKKIGINWHLRYQLEKGRAEILQMKVEILRKRLAKYGNQILNSTYFELTKFI